MDILANVAAIVRVLLVAVAIGAGVTLWANRDGCEWLARLFLKLARSEKVDGYHSHHTLEFGSGPPQGEPELTIGIVHKPNRGARAV